MGAKHTRPNGIPRISRFTGVPGKRPDRFPIQRPQSPTASPSVPAATLGSQPAPSSHRVLTSHSSDHHLKIMFSRSNGYSMMPVVGTRTRSTSCWVGR